MNELSRPESDRLRELEDVVERGILTFYEVGTALAEIRESRLYRVTHATFDDYCRERWDMTRGRANQLVRAAEIVGNLDTRVSKPVSESQVRPLARLPLAEQSEAWEEAVSTSPDGKVTSQHVREVVDRRVGKHPGQPKSEGRHECRLPSNRVGAEREPGEDDDLGDDGSGGSVSRVNGVMVADPPDVATARAAGRIAADTVVEVSEPDGDDTQASAGEPEASLTDVEWLASLPVRSQLAKSRLKWFDSDARLYRELETARRSYMERAKRALASARRLGGEDGSFYFQVRRFLRLEHPRHWAVCVAPEHGGCGGTGEVVAIGPCPRCYGRGYVVR